MIKDDRMLTDFLSSIRQKIPHQIAQLYSKLMPIQCILCGSDHSEQIICEPCRSELPGLGNACPRCASPLQVSSLCGNCLTHPPVQTVTISLYPYLPPIDRLISDMKYHNKLYLTNFFAQQLCDKVKDRPLPDMLIPIPLHPTRLQHRGYNQSWEIARLLAHKLSIPVCHDALKRVRNTLPQASLPFSKRKQNLSQAFALGNISLPDHVALIDDVVTTGHTANMAGKVLQKAGVDQIELWTIARTIRHY